MAEQEPFCCCEYRNMAGQKSHILQCCCDCEALDEGCDRWISCQAIPQNTKKKIFATILDRIRIPGFLGEGAVQVKLDIAAPIIIVPSCLCLATISVTYSVIMLMLMPLVMLLVYRVWRRQQTRVRNSFFLAWGVTSVVFSVLVFLSYVISFRAILLWEIMTLVTGVFLMFRSFILARNHTGILKSSHKSKSRQTNFHNPGSQKSADHSRENSDGQFVIVDLDSGEYHKQLNRVDGDNRDDSVVENKVLKKDSYQEQYAMSQAPTLPEKDVKWIDSRPIEDGNLITWCSVCAIKKPARAGHCNVCDACISVRDHHCVWIDRCIGSANHRYFLASIIIFIFCGFYGAHLTVTSLCAPDMVYDWFLYPKDCRFIYGDFRSALCFVTACYSAMASLFMSLVLIYQVILISQNITSQELHRASLQGKTRFCLFVTGNIHDQGILRNWLEFTFSRNKRVSTRIPL